MFVRQNLLPLILTTLILLYLLFHFVGNPCKNYKILNENDRKSSYSTPTNGPEYCDDQLPTDSDPAEWYRLMGDAGTKMPIKRVDAYHCGTVWSGWLDGAHPALKDGEVHRTVCFSDRPTGCKHTTEISVKNCGAYFIYKLFKPPGCNSRYCGTD